MGTEVSDNKIFEKAYERAKKAIGDRSSLTEMIVFLEKEIDDYRRKLDYAEKRIQALCAQQMQNIQIEQKLNKERKELHKPATAAEIIKAAAVNGYDITINFFKREGNTND